MLSKKSFGETAKTILSDPGKKKYARLKPSDGPGLNSSLFVLLKRVLLQLDRSQFVPFLVR